ncbi:hypothetical protein N7463_002856 [Penicillium fimorum]|uniref:Uncharacterized protein n=1 Tax=Penicillium fimorum TaxID=1882269 RepID=A0A9X0C9C7_9EURO|nr:hypothetical protein N7463_002856 [Penicillium fimorum]
MNGQTYLSSSSFSDDSVTNPPANHFGPGAGNVPQTIHNTFPSGWDSPSQINFLFRPGGAHTTPRPPTSPSATQLELGCVPLALTTSTPSNSPPDDDEITAPEIPTHDPDFLEEDEDGSDYEPIDEILGDFGVDRLGWEWRVEEGEGQTRPFPPGYFERLEAELDDIIAGRDTQQAEGSDSGQEDVGYVIEVEDIADEARDGDEDATLDEE